MTEKQKPKQVQKQVQLTLPKILEQEEELESNKVYASNQFCIKTKCSRVEGFIAKLNKTTKAGKAVYDDTQKRQMMIDWIQKKIKPTKLASDMDLTGEDYILSKTALIKQIFGEEFEKVESS